MYFRRNAAEGMICFEKSISFSLVFNSFNAAGNVVNTKNLWIGTSPVKKSSRSSLLCCYVSAKISVSIFFKVYEIPFQTGPKQASFGQRIQWVVGRVLLRCRLWIFLNSDSCVSDVSVMGRETTNMLEQVFQELSIIKGRNSLVCAFSLPNKFPRDVVSHRCQTSLHELISRSRVLVVPHRDGCFRGSGTWRFHSRRETANIG